MVHLYRRQDLHPDRCVVRSTLARKCEFKGIPVPTYAALSDRPERAAIEVEWEQMLGQSPRGKPNHDWLKESRDGVKRALTVLPIIVGVCMLAFRVRGQTGKGVQDRGDVVRHVLGVRKCSGGQGCVHDDCTFGQVQNGTWHNK